MRINNNISAMNTYSRLNSANNAKSGSLARLSSGLRINRAGDDAAGLAISEKMRGQVGGLKQATRNAQDGISMIQTAEGALSETHSILQRMRELSVQASSDTNTTDDRKEIQKEMNQLTSEINRIGNTTEFNTQKVLKGGAEATGKTGIVTSIPYAPAGTSTPTGAIGSVTGTPGSTGVQGTTSFTIETALGAGDTFDVAGKTITVYADQTALDAANGNSGDTNGILVDTADNQATAISTILNTGTGVSSTVLGSTVTVTQDVAETGDVTEAGTLSGPPAAAATQGSVEFNIATAFAEGDTLTVGGTTFEFTADGTGAAIGNTAIDLSSASTAVDQAGEIRAELGGGDLTVGGSGANITLTQTVAGTGTITAPTSAGAGGADFAATLQIGANEGQNFKVEIKDMRASALGISGGAGESADNDGGAASFAAINNTDRLTDLSGTEAEYALDLSTNEKASAAITIVDKAIANVSAERSKLGSVQNRLDHTINNLTATAENLTEAESRIRDVDMAEEMMQFTKNNILSQAATSMLAQANQMPQSVLQLLQ